MHTALYEITVQVVPVLMIALFLDTRIALARTARSARSERLQTAVFLFLCVGAFVVSLLIVADVLVRGRVTDALVISALIGCIGLMAAKAWTRLTAAPKRDAQ
ncbi:hypothetical protein [Microbacterium sp. SA39]|uniref:hypothetical protein n=1 Tax=Microbacterium sp. SA39 TaxID=1263625 RepID=UPI0005FA4CEC|nr:hypothetical protein [Microbacterium sp. SA39]KJQ52708.1 hypothetical protein RS85_03601 [Microbacterium sp. SA39]